QNFIEDVQGRNIGFEIIPIFDLIIDEVINISAMKANNDVKLLSSMGNTNCMSWIETGSAGHRLVCTDTGIECPQQSITRCRIFDGCLADDASAVKLVWGIHVAMLRVER